LRDFLWEQSHCRFRAPLIHDYERALKNSLAVPINIVAILVLMKAWLPS